MMEGNLRRRRGRTCLELEWLGGSRRSVRFPFLRIPLLNVMKGAPLALTPYRDNATYRQPSWINNFDYTTGGHPPSCPFAAHIRKMAPRNLDPLIQKQYLDAAVIVRSGIPYGDDVGSFFQDNCVCILTECRLRKRSEVIGRSLLMNRKRSRRVPVASCSFAISHLSITDTFSRLLVLGITVSSLLLASYPRNMVRHTQP